MKKKNIRLMCLSGVLTALVFVVTAYLHIPTANGYVHVGDGIIYLAACLLPTPYAVAVGAGGALLADCLTGYAVWAPATAIIKAIQALLFSSKRGRIIGAHNLLMFLPAAAICAAGYYLYESVLYGNFIAPLTGIPASLIQSAASTALFIAVGLAIDNMHIGNKLKGGF